MHAIISLLHVRCILEADYSYANRNVCNLFPYEILRWQFVKVLMFRISCCMCEQILVGRA